jgi:microcin C transport system permease protein
MSAYILRRLLLVIPTLIGIMVVNFTLTQFVPGGPIEQIIAQMEGGGDVFEASLAAAAESWLMAAAATTLDRAACRRGSLKSWKKSSVSTSRRWSGSCR